MEAKHPDIIVDQSPAIAFTVPPQVCDPEAKQILDGPLTYTPKLAIVREGLKASQFVISTCLEPRF